MAARVLFVLSMFLINLQAFAQGAPEQVAGGADAAATSPYAGWLNILLIVGIILFMYLFVIRPQSRAAKLHREFLASLTSGVEVVTSGGLIGTIEEVQDNLIRIRLDGGNVIRVLKSAVSTKWDPSSLKK